MGFWWSCFLFVKKGINFIYLVVDWVIGFDGVIYMVLFIGIGDGWLFKVVSLGFWVYLIEEL